MNHSRIGNTHLIIELNLFLKSFQPVWSLSFDWMYLVHFGVFKRLLLAWMKWNGPWKLHHTAVDAITVALKIIESSCPSDFNRKPREFNLAHYKATEFRRILLYDGIVIFKDNVLFSKTMCTNIFFFCTVVCIFLAALF